MRIHLAGLKLFRSTVEAYFYIVFDGSELPSYYDSTSVIRQAREDFTKFENRKEEIASAIPGNAIEPFHNFLSFYKTVDQLSHEKDEDMYEAWKGAEEELDKVIAILSKEINDNNPSFFWFSKIARPNRK